jgi:hypothetical protein
MCIKLRRSRRYQLSYMYVARMIHYCELPLFQEICEALYDLFYISINFTSKSDRLRILKSMWSFISKITKRILICGILDLHQKSPCKFHAGLYLSIINYNLNKIKLNFIKFLRNAGFLIAVTDLTEIYILSYVVIAQFAYTYTVTIKLYSYTNKHFSSQQPTLDPF